MKRVLYFLSFLICISLVTLDMDVYAKSSQNPSRTDKQNIIEVRVGVYPFSGFYEKNNESNQYSGYAVEYLKGIGRVAGFKYCYIEYPDWNACYEAIQKDEIDVIAATLDHPYEAKNVVLSNFSMARTHMCLYTLKENDTYAFNDYTNFSGMKIAMVKNEPRNVLLEKMMKIKEVSYQPLYYDTFDEMVQAIHDQKADAYFADWYYSSNKEQVIAKFNLVDLYFMLNNNHPEMVSRFNRGMEALLLQQPQFSQIQAQRFFPNQFITPVVPTVREKEFLKKNKVIRVWYKDNWAPISYQYNNEARGIAPDTMRNMEKHCGLKFEFCPMGDKSVEEIMEIANPNDVFCTVINDEKLLAKYKLKTSAPYAHTPLTTVQRKGSEYDPSKKGTIAILEGDINTPYIVARYSSQLTPVYYSSVEACIEAVTDGSCNITSQAGYVITDFMQRPQGTELDAISTGVNRVHHCVAFMPNCSPELISIVNKGIAALTPSDQGNPILRSTVNSIYQRSFKDILISHAIPIFIFVVLILTGILAYIIWSRCKIAKVAYEDSLTGCLSFPGFLRKVIPVLHERNHSWIIATLDIAGFKMTNNRLGREEGNQLLIGLANALKSSLQENEFICRNAADNFVLLLNYSDRETLCKRIDQLDENLKLKKLNGTLFKKQAISVGICSTEEAGYDLDKLIGNANIARSEAKLYHRTNYVFYDKKMHNKIIEEQELEADIRPGLENHEFLVYLQPKFSLANGRIVGAEALVRWQHPKKGFLPPDLFIPIAERKELIDDIDFYVYREVFKSLHDWLEAGHEAVRISLNVSRSHIEDVNFIQHFCELADEYEIPHNYIECELTESLFCSDMSVLNKFTSDLKKEGFWVSIDDFGSGYSSLNMLENTPVDVLKLDREFFNKIDLSNRGRIIIGNIITMAKALEMEVISEGVETDSQATLLNKLNCDMAQGYLFSKPMPSLNFYCILLCQEQGRKILFPADKFEYPTEVMQVVNNINM